MFQRDLRQWAKDKKCVCSTCMLHAMGQADIMDMNRAMKFDSSGMYVVNSFLLVSY